MTKSAPSKMRAKVKISAVFPTLNASSEILHINGVGKSGTYGEDGLDEDNTYAKFTPSLNMQILITNPDLLGQFAVGETFYLDFIPAPK